MNNQNIISAGVAQVNNDRVASVVSRAKSIILAIETEQASIATRVKAIEEQTKVLKSLEKLDVTYSSVFGTAAPATPNANQDAILKALEEMQKQRSESVAAKSKNIVELIQTHLELNVKAEARIAEHRKALGELVVTEVTAAAIVG